MSWFVEGNGEKLHIGILDSGNLSIWGDASSHDVRAVGGDTNSEFYKKLGEAACSWSIHPSNEQELHLDGTGTGFFQKTQDSPDKCMASIVFHQDPDLVGITISLPSKTFQLAKELFKSVLLQPDLVYLITLDFHGFRVPEAVTETPSIEEFLAGSLDGKVYISEEASILIKRISQDA